MQFWPAFVSPLVMTWTSLYLLRLLLFFVDVRTAYSHLIIHLRTFSVKKNINLWKIFGNWVCTCYCIVIFPYLLKSWNRVRVPG